MLSDQSILIREATLDDMQRIAEIKVENHGIGDIAHPLDRILNDLFVREYTKRWANHLEAGMRTLIVAVDGYTVGFICYSGSRKIAEINNIYIIPEYRGQQLGKRLCIDALAKMKEESFSEVIVWIVSGRQQAQRFYKNMGFQLTADSREDSISDDVVLHELQYSYTFE